MKEKPIIGVVICGEKQHRQYISTSYISAILHAGGFPIVIPFVCSRKCFNKYVSLCDGFLFCGGDDITSLLFGEQPLSSSGEVNLQFDLFQIYLMRRVLSDDKPLLAICRGMQILNVALGGTLYQDLTSYPHQTIHHMQISQLRSDPSHIVTVEAHTLLHHILTCSFIYTNSFHHQAVHRLGKGLIVSAKSRDHIIEAIEMPSKSFVLGIQWHPECMLTASTPMRNIFQTFIQQCHPDK